MYTAFYQLKEEPFRLTPDPRFLHLADPHRTALKVLLQGVLQRKGFTVVAGPGTLTVAWNGKAAAGGTVYSGRYVAHVIATSTVGTSDLTAAFTVRRRVG